MIIILFCFMSLGEYFVKCSTSGKKMTFKVPHVASSAFPDISGKLAVDNFVKFSVTSKEKVRQTFAGGTKIEILIS